MQRFNQLLVRHLEALIYCSAFLLPFASQLIQSVLYQTTAICLRGYDAIVHLLGTGAIGVIGLLMLVLTIYKSVKTNRHLPHIQILITAFTASLIVAACILALKWNEGFCGGPLGDCGRWI